MREQFMIVGSGSGDFLASCCCHCCTLVQMEKELVRSSNIESGSYESFPGMVYQRQ